MKRKLVIFGVALAALMTPLLPAQAITYGTDDQSAHPMVGQVFYFNPNGYDPRFSNTTGGWYSCTGTLVDATHVVTAGHCTYPVGSGGTDVWFDVSNDANPDLFGLLPPSYCFADLGVELTQTQIDTCAGFGVTDSSTGLAGGNDARNAAWRAALDSSASQWVNGTAYTSPDYDPSTFYMDDLGVLVLNRYMAGPYALLPTAGLVDQLYNNDKNGTYTVVGYGRQGSKPWGDWGGGVRYDGTVKINNTNGVWGYGKGPVIALSSNNGQPHQGGTCYGDSGGPALWTDANGAPVAIAVTSFGVDPYCNSGTGAYRLDVQESIDFLATFGLSPAE